jgi:hypothetical protein
MNCDTCFPDFVAKCNEAIRVFAQLPALAAYESYKWVITDKFDKKYEGPFVVDENGFWEIPVEDLPEGLLTEYSGNFSLEVYDDTCKPVKFKIAQEYDCIKFNVKGGTFEKDYIGCSFSCTEAPAGQSALFPFTDAATFDITWAPYLSLYGNSPTVQVYHETAPGVFQLVSVQVQQIFTDGVLTTISIDNGGVQTGYVIVS